MSCYGRFKDHKYEWSKPFTSVRHNWSFRGPRGGVNFHVSIHDSRDTREETQNMAMTNDAEAAEHHMSGNRTERVCVPVGLVEELMTWCNDELERAAQGTQFRADLIYFHDELLGAKEGY